MTTGGNGDDGVADGRRTDDGPGRTERPTATRRTVLRTAAAASAAGLAVGTGAIGSGTGATSAAPPLTRCGNELRDPTGQPVILRGVKIADPGRQLRPWRAQTADETVALALDRTAIAPPGTEVADAGVEGWHNDLIRIPVQPQDVYAGTANGGSDPAGAMPHGDPWGPVLPGEAGDSPAPITEATLTEYVEEILDPLIDQIEAAGAYALLSYHREYPVYHQVRLPWEETDYGCSEGSIVDSMPGCGERGVLWHGADQTEAVRENAPSRYEGSRTDGPYLEPESVASALDREVRTFWEFVASEYADRNHVLFDLYAAPWGPWEWKWGAPDRVPFVGDSIGPPEPGEDPIWWKLWLDRVQPWVDVVEANAPGSVVVIGGPRQNKYTAHAGRNGEVDAASLQACYAVQLYMQDNIDMAEDFGPAAEQVPVFLTEFGWAEGGGIDEWGYLAGTSYEGMDRFEAFLEEFPVHATAAHFDNAWKTSFFVESEATVGDDGRDPGDWMQYLHPWEDRPGQWWMRYLYDHRDEDTPSAGSGTAVCRDRTPAAVGGNEGLPTDPDADGLYEDVNGNERRDIADAVDLFQHQESVDPAFFDFNDSGSMEIGDAVTLFRENTG